MTSSIVGARRCLVNTRTATSISLSGWQGDIPFGGKANNGTHGEMVRVPIARNPDGSPLTGPVLARFIDAPLGAKTLMLAKSTTYGQNDIPPIPFDLDTHHARLITKKYEDIDGAEGGLGGNFIRRMGLGGL